MNLARLLAAAPKPITVGLIGAGKFGAMFLAMAARQRPLVDEVAPLFRGSVSGGRRYLLLQEALAMKHTVISHTLIC